MRAYPELAASSGVCVSAIALSASPPGLELELANPERVRSLPAVKKAETLDFSSGRPVPAGLFDPAIFGPFSDSPSPIDETQPVDAADFPAGRLALAQPLIHPLIASRCREVIATEASLPLDVTTAGLGFEDLEHRRALLRGLEASALGRTFIINELPILPAALRPMVALAEGRWASLGVNALYRAVLNRNTRLRRLIDLNAPEVIINNEVRLLHEALLELMTGEVSSLDEREAPEEPELTVPLCKLVPGGLEAGLSTLDPGPPLRRKTLVITSVLWALGFGVHTVNRGG